MKKFFIIAICFVFLTACSGPRQQSTDKKPLTEEQAWQQALSKDTYEGYYIFYRNYLHTTRIAALKDNFSKALLTERNKKVNAENLKLINVAESEIFFNLPEFPQDSKVLFLSFQFNSEGIKILPLHKSASKIDCSWADDLQKSAYVHAGFDNNPTKFFFFLRQDLWDPAKFSCTVQEGQNGLALKYLGGKGYMVAINGDKKVVFNFNLDPLFVATEQNQNDSQDNRGNTTKQTIDSSKIISSTSLQNFQQEFSDEFPRMLIGDEWRIDTLRGIVVRKVIKVEPDGSFVLEEKSETNSDIFHLYYDNSYRLTAKVNKETGIYSKITKPPHNYLNFPLTIGKTWNDEVYAHSTDGNYYNYRNTYTVEIIEVKKIECGAFRSFKINIVSLNVEKNRSFKESFWYSPDLKIIIKSEATWKKDTEVLAYTKGVAQANLPSTQQSPAVSNESSTRETGVKNEKVSVGLNSEANRNNLQNSDSANKPVIIHKPSDNTPKSQDPIEFGVQMILRGDFINAIDLFDKALSTDQVSSKAWTYKGFALIRLRRTQESLDSFDRALSIDDMNLLAYSGKIRALYALSRGSEATKLIEKAIKMKPKDAMGYLGLGAVYHAQKNYHIAIKQYEEAIRLQPNCIEAFLNLGDAYDELNDNEKAIQNYQKAISLNSTCALAYINMGQTYAKRDDIDKASEMFTHAIKINPNYSAAYFNRGLLYRKQKQFDKALQDYDKAIELDPAFPNTYNERGLINGQRGNYRTARQDWQKTIDLDPSGPVGERARKNLSILKEMGY
jgi:tetratricopeptide (TPR) repeat protein